MTTTDIPRAAVDRPPPRTLLEQLIRCSKRTIEENCAAFEKTARNNGEDATLSPRTIQRWMAGEVAMARPVMQRVVELHWGYEFEALVGSPIEESGNGKAVAVNGHGHADALGQEADGRALDAAPLVVHPARTNGATVQLVIAPGSAVVVVPADHPMLVALVTGE